MKTKSIVLAVWLSVTVSAFAQLAPEKGASGATGAKEAVASKPAVEVTLVQKKVVQADNGTERLVDADTAKPGDVIEYQATYINKTDKPVSQVIASLPLPEGLEYVPKSAKPSGSARMSAQDKQFGVEPLSRRSLTGKTEPVPYNEYRDIRWTIGQIPVAKSVTVTARAKVEAVVPQTSAPTAAAVGAAGPKASTPAAAIKP